MAITNLPTDRIGLYLQSKVVSAAVKEALAEVVKQKQAVEEVARQVADAQRQIDAIGQEQARIRENMAQIDHASEIYSRYLKKFSDQEDQIEGLRQRMESLRQEMTRQQKALDDYLVGLSLD